MSYQEGQVGKLSKRDLLQAIGAFTGLAAASYLGISRLNISPDLSLIRPRPFEAQRQLPEISDWGSFGSEQINANYDQILAWYQRMAKAVALKTYSIGQSYGTKQKIFTVSSAPIETAGEKTYLAILSRVHPRERTAGAVADAVYYSLIQQGLPDDFVAVIVPVVNPDGLDREMQVPGTGYKNNHAFAYTYERPAFSDITACTNSEEEVPGADINRNFPMGGDPEVKASYLARASKSNPCSDKFGGDQLALEPETQAVMDFIQLLQSVGRVGAVIDFHGYIGKVIRPNHQSTENEKLVNVYAQSVGYESIPVSYLASQGGTAVDWVAAQGIPVFGVETQGGGEGYVAGENSRSVKFYEDDPAFLRTEIPKHIKATQAVVKALTN